MSNSRQGQNQISPSKSRSKLEALDTLVISTIHNVSNKLCSSSAGVLRQAAAVFPEQDEEQVSGGLLGDCQLFHNSYISGLNFGDSHLLARGHGSSSKSCQENLKRAVRNVT